MKVQNRLPDLSSDPSKAALIWVGIITGLEIIDQTRSPELPSAIYFLTESNENRAVGAQAMDSKQTVPFRANWVLPRGKT